MICTIISATIRALYHLLATQLVLSALLRLILGVWSHQEPHIVWSYGR